MGVGKVLLLKKLCCLTFVGILLEELWLLLDRDSMEYVVYHAFSTGFGSLGDAFFMQLHCSYIKHQEGFDTVYQLLKNPVLHPF